MNNTTVLTNLACSPTFLDLLFHDLYDSSANWRTEALQFFGHNKWHTLMWFYLTSVSTHCSMCVCHMSRIYFLTYSVKLKVQFCICKPWLAAISHPKPLIVLSHGLSRLASRKDCKPAVRGSTPRLWSLDMTINHIGLHRASAGNTGPVPDRSHRLGSCFWCTEVFSSRVGALALNPWWFILNWIRRYPSPI